MKIWTDRTAWLSRRARQKADLLSARSVKKIAVIKHAGLGDLVLTRPFLVTLRRYFEGAEITLSLAEGRRAGAPLDLAHHVHYADGTDRPGAVTREFSRRFRTIGKQDILFDLTANTCSFWISRLTDARLKVGFRHRLIHPLVYDVAVPRTEYRFEAETFLDQLAVLGVDRESPIPYAFPATPAAPGRPYVVYFPGASTSAKRWPRTHWSELVERAAGRYQGYDHVVQAGIQSDEIELAHRITENIAHRGNVRMEMDTSGTTGRIAAAAMLVSGDTGLRNLAIATGTPTVGIFSSTLPFRYLPRDGFHVAIWREEGGHPKVTQVEAATRRRLD